MKKIFLISFLICLVLVSGGIFYFRYLEKERHRFKIVFLNVGQGDATLIQFEDGEKMLVDCGPDRTILSALGRNLAFFDRTIDYVVTTHPDLDHYGGCPDVLKNFQVKEIIANGKTKLYDPYFREWQKEMDSSGAVEKNIRKPETFSLAGSSLQFLSPDPVLNLPDQKEDSNNFSIVLRLTHEGKNFLLTGDMEAPLEKALADKYCSKTESCPLQSDVLKVAHHGSSGSSSELFLSFVKPKTAVISVGKNKYGHPALRTIRHLERAGASILRTDRVGDIVWE